MSVGRFSLVRMANTARNRSKRRARPARNRERDGMSPLPESHRPMASAVNDMQVSALLCDVEVDPGLLIEMLLPVLWLSRVETFSRNSSVEGCMVLHHAYDLLGIASDVYTVTLWITNPSNDQSTEYGRPDPCWDNGILDGHCLLWLPQSGRAIDVSVEQFPAAVGSVSAPLMGRIGGANLRGWQTADGELPPGTYLAMSGRAVYELTGPRYRDLVTSSLASEDNERYRRAGVNLASRALTLMRIGPVADRVRGVPYPRLHALLDAVGTAEFVVEPGGDFFFTFRDDDTERSLRLDEIPIGEVMAAASDVEKTLRPPGGSTYELIKQTLLDVDTEARTLRRATAAAGGGDLPVVFFEPRAGVGVQTLESGKFEAQAEALIAAGFGRFLPGSPAVPRLPLWSVRHSSDGLELWDEGGIWARAELSVSDEWLAAAARHRVVRVVYGILVGVRIPEGRNAYSEADREAELVQGRRSGIVAVAEIPWKADRRTSRWPWRRRTFLDRQGRRP